ncbi:MAG TPA: aminopeptidase P N-terminal domain-containing protein [Pelomicrobium sp.]|nr:aminopeptidase P N-terminal domain-containing protein [Pelomicrobium sp.]
MDTTTRDTTPFVARRRRLAGLLDGAVAVIATAPERVRNRDALHPFRFDSYFYYLTGFDEPEAVLVLAGGESPRSILFCRTKDPDKEVWDGFRWGPEAAREAFGFDEARPIAELDAAMPDLLADRPAVYCAVGADPAWDARVIGWINAVRVRVRSGVAAPEEIRDVRAALDEMRLVKDEHEVGVMRRAAVISCAAHRRAMAFARPGVFEYEVEAELVHEFRRRGAQALAYSPIVAGGANACVLHYVANRERLRDGDLLLIDAGCELDGYASDITRTFPVNGAFSAAQQAIYELVLAMQSAAMQTIRPGATWNAPHDAALQVLAQGLIDLGLVAGSPDEVLEKETYKPFYMHRTGHWLGLDVHDAGDYKRAGSWRPLEPGMTFTVEPGCYVRPGDGVPEKFWNIGVRIEDDVVVTAGGCEVLTADAPKTIDGLTAWMRESRRDAA